MGAVQLVLQDLRRGLEANECVVAGQCDLDSTGPFHEMRFNNLGSIKLESHRFNNRTLAAVGLAIALLLPVLNGCGTETDIEPLLPDALGAAEEVDEGATLLPNLASTSSGYSNGDTIAYLSFDTSMGWRSSTNCCKYIYDSHNDNEFRIPHEGDWDDLHGWISPNKGYNSQRSFGVKLDSVDACPSKQRVEFELSNRNYYPQHMEESRYYGLAMYIHPQSQPIMKPTYFLQTWQNHNTTYGRYPPFSLRFLEGADYKWQVHMSKGGGEPEDAPGTRRAIYTSPTGLAKGVWHTFVVWFKPSRRNAGAVRVWHNGDYKVEQTHPQNFGYSINNTRGQEVLDQFQIRFGAYRGRLCNPQTQFGNTILFFDEVRLGTTYDSVVP